MSALIFRNVFSVERLEAFVKACLASGKLDGFAVLLHRGSRGPAEDMHMQRRRAFRR